MLTSAKAIKVILLLIGLFVVAIALTVTRQRPYAPPLMRAAGPARRPDAGAWFMVALWGTLIVLSLLSGCGGGGGAAAAAVAPIVPPASTSTGTAPTTGTQSLPHCEPGVTQGYATVCQCPAADVVTGGCSVPCPDGETVNGNGQCTALAVNPTPPVQPPPACPTGYTLEGSECVPPPSPVIGLTVTAGAATAVLTWQSVNATACYLGASALAPVSLNGSQTVQEGANATAYTLVCGNVGGNAEVSATVPGATPGTPPPVTPPPVTPPAYTVQVTPTPPVVTDASGCPADANGVPCTSQVTVSTSNGTGLCSVNGGAQEDSTNYAWVMGPYSVDGPVTLAVSCTDQFGDTGTASVILTVQAPYVRLPDTFTVAPNGDGTYTFTWATQSVQGAGGCSVQLLNASGVDASPPQGGASAGSATTGFLSPAGDPWTATLVCSGSPDAGVPAITLTP